MSKRMTVEQATRRIIDRNPERDKIDAFMRQYVSIRELAADEYEHVHRSISDALFGGMDEVEEMSVELVERAVGDVADETADEIAVDATEAAETSEKAVGESMALTIVPEPPTPQRDIALTMPTLEDIGYILAGIGDIVGMCVDEIRADIPIVGRKAGAALEFLSLVGADILHALGIILPMIAKWLCILWAGSIWPVSVKVTVMALRIAREFGGGLALTSMRVAAELRSLWEGREELIAEYKAA